MARKLGRIGAGSLAGKIWMLVALLSIFTLGASLGYQQLVQRVKTLGTEQATGAMMEGHQRELKSLVDSMAGLLARALEGVETEEARQDLIVRMLEKVRYLEDQSGYFFVYQPGGVAITVPPKPQLRGKNLMDTKDQNGVFFIRELIAAADAGGGFVTYHFDKPGKGIQPKLSYAKKIPGTPYMFGTGVYIDNVEEARVSIVSAIDGLTSSYVGTLALITGSLFCLVILPSAVLVIRNITRPMGQTVHMIQQLEKGHLDQRLNLNRSDEIGQMASTMDAFADSLQREVVDPLYALAGGDLTFSVKPKDEKDVLRGSILKLGEDLNTLLGEIQTASEFITLGSSQVSDFSQSLSQGATEQAGALEEVSASITQLSSQTRVNVDNAMEANALSDQARTAAERGNGQMSEMVGAMTEINSASQSISRIIKVIDEIAFQTNLLALNAAVEAARAGQHGKGFAVVAEEVRNLAARSAKAAKETAELIESSVHKVEAGSHIADRTAKGLEEIVRAIGQSSRLVGQISMAGKEQAAGIDQVSLALGQIGQVTQTNTANSEESAAAAEELASQAEQLRHMLGRFKLKGQSSQGHAPHKGGAAASRQLGW